MKTTLAFALLSLISSSLLLGALAQGGCGNNAGGVTCTGGHCCSKFGSCGSTEGYCSYESQCPSTPTPTPTTPTPTPSGDGSGDGCDLSSLIPESLFNDMLKHRTDTACKGGFFTYNAFITAAQSYPAFGTTGDTDTCKREIAAFLGQTSHETTGGYLAAPDGPYAWGYCFVQENNPSDYCEQSTRYPCVAGKQYYGRGPIMLTWNLDYGRAGYDLNQNFLANPDVVATDPIISFKTALWFWMTAQPPTNVKHPKPSSHDVITGQWAPSTADTAANRLPGYGLITNIINGEIECANGAENMVQDRIGFYNRYCRLLKVSAGDNLDCANQTTYRK